MTRLALIAGFTWDMLRSWGLGLACLGLFGVALGLHLGGKL